MPLIRSLHRVLSICLQCLYAILPYTIHYQFLIKFYSQLAYVYSTAYPTYDNISNSMLTVFYFPLTSLRNELNELLSELSSQYFKFYVGTSSTCQEYWFSFYQPPFSSRRYSVTAIRMTGVLQCSCKAKVDPLS